MKEQVLVLKSTVNVQSDYLRPGNAHIAHQHTISVLLVAANWHKSFSPRLATLSGTCNTTTAHFCFLSWVPTELINNVVLI